MKYKQHSILLKLTDIVFVFVEALLGLRVVLKLFGANPGAAFVNWVYEISQPLLRPFEGAFPAPTVEGGFVIEFSALFGLIVYALIGYLITRLIIALESETIDQE